MLNATIDKVSLSLIDDISKTVLISQPAILKVLRKDIEKYNKEREFRKETEKANKKEKYEKIQEYYYVYKVSPSNIAKILNTSKSTVTRAIQLNPKYEEERRQRIGSSENYHDDMVIAQLLKLQEQNAISMSRKGKLTAEDMVSINRAHYRYNPSKNRLEFDESCGKKPSDLPQYI